MKNLPVFIKDKIEKSSSERQNFEWEVISRRLHRVSYPKFMTKFPRYVDFEMSLQYFSKSFQRLSLSKQSLKNVPMWQNPNCTVSCFLMDPYLNFNTSTVGSWINRTKRFRCWCVQLKLPFHHVSWNVFQWKQIVFESYTTHIYIQHNNSLCCSFFTRRKITEIIALKKVLVTNVKSDNFLCCNRVSWQGKRRSHEFSSFNFFNDWN